MKASRVLPLTDARARLSGIVDEAQRSSEPIGISVHGDVRAYIIGAQALSELQAAAHRSRRSTEKRSKLRGSLRIVGDVDAASKIIKQAIQRSAAKLRDE